jgi:hypothetical protein
VLLYGPSVKAPLRPVPRSAPELLIVLANTAESVGDRDHRYANQFHQLTTQLRTIADLDDLTVIRSSLMQRATDLKTCVDQMARDSP